MIGTRYFAPASIAEATRLLFQYRDKSRLIAGGTDLVVQMKKGKVSPEYIINIKSIPELNFIVFNETEGLRIGALTTIAALCNSALIARKFKIIAHSVSTLGTPTVRRQATIGGNICNAAPSADTLPALMVLDARVKITGISGDRIVPIEKFCTGPGQTCLEADQMLVEVLIPPISSSSGAVYLKQKRSRGADIAMVGAATLVKLDNNICRDVKIALGAVAPTPIRATRAEQYLKGKNIDDGLLEEAGRIAATETRPIDDVRSTADYRKKITQTLVERALKEAVEQAGQEDR